MSNTATLELVTYLTDCLEQSVCDYCDRKGDGREPCEGCGAPPKRKCFACGWRVRGRCDAPAHLRCPVQRWREAA